MCTLSVHHAQGDVLVTMNRDEMITRAPETPPVISRTASGVAWIAPKDGEKGGTWMGANDRGVVACLLNFYQPGESLLPEPDGRYRSRGEIIPLALANGSGDAVVSWLLESFDPAAYPSFDLHVITAQAMRRFIWLKKGPLEMIEVHNTWSVYSSSGWDSGDVIRWRDDRFREWVDNGEPKSGHLPTFHVLQEPGHEDRSPLMTREWSTTRSITQVQFTPGGTELIMRYWPKPRPDSKTPATTDALSLVAAGAPPIKAKAP